MILLLQKGIYIFHPLLNTRNEISTAIEDSIIAYSFLLVSSILSFFCQNWTRIQTSRNIHSLIKSAKISAFCVNFQEKICALFMKSDGSTAHFKNERPWENSDFLISQTHTQNKHNEVKAFITCISKSSDRSVVLHKWFHTIVSLCES